LKSRTRRRRTCFPLGGINKIMKELIQSPLLIRHNNIQKSSYCTRSSCNSNNSEQQKKDESQVCDIYATHVARTFHYSKESETSLGMEPK